MHRENVTERSKLFWKIELMVICTTGTALIGWGFLCLFNSKYKIYYCVLSIGILTNMFDITWLERQKGNLITKDTVFSILLRILQRYIVTKIGKKGFWRLNHYMVLFKVIVARNSAFRLIGMALLFTLIKSNDDLQLYIFITVVMSLLSNISMAIYEAISCKGGF